MSAPESTTKNCSFYLKSFFTSPYLFFLLIAYLIMGTGLATDDFVFIYLLDNTDMIAGVGHFFERPLHYFVLGSFFQIIAKNMSVYAYVKIIYICISFIIISDFFSLYYRKEISFFLSFFFLFFPTHDSTVYMYINLYLTLTIAFYLYAFYLAKKDKLVMSFIMALFASFVSYGSTPIAFMLAVLFLFRKDLKKAIVMLVPNLIYIFYFFCITSASSVFGMPARKTGSLNFVVLLKQFILQLFSFADSAIGPSFWLKIYYSFLELSFLSIVIGVVFVIFFYKNYEEKEEKYNKGLLLSFTLLAVLSFLMFTVTGRYPQLAFNLGNRTTIYGSLLLTYIIVLLPVRKVAATVIFGLMLFSVLGISDHWKSWNKHQLQVIQNIKTNQQLIAYKDNRTIFVSGSQYSKFGKISHIEFFSESYVVDSVFKLALNKEVHAATINKRFKYENGFLIDTKYNEQYVVNNYINVYDSEKNILFRIDKENINDYIKSLPFDNRHWVQLIDNELINGLIVKLMPRLKYAF